MRIASWFLLILAVAGVAGRWLPILDIVNSVAPQILISGLVMMGMALWWRSPGAVLVALLAVVVSGLPVLREYTRTAPPRSASANADGLVVVTHNVRFDNRRPLETVTTLQSSGADIILLQETDRYNWSAMFDRARYPYHSVCPERGCSLLILSRWPIAVSRYRVRDLAGQQIGPPLVWATIAPPNGPRFDVATLHLPWPGPDQARKRRELVRAIGKLSGERLIFAGDLNLTPWSWAMRDTEAGLAPLTRVTRATWSYPARIGAGAAVAPPLLPIDHVFAGPGWRVGQVDRLSRTGSDHYPIRVRLIARRTGTDANPLPR